MGKGDRKTKRGKITSGSYGRVRPSKRVLKKTQEKHPDYDKVVKEMHKQ